MLNTMLLELHPLAIHDIWEPSQICLLVYGKPDDDSGE